MAYSHSTGGIQYSSNNKLRKYNNLDSKSCLTLKLLLFVRQRTQDAILVPRPWPHLSCHECLCRHNNRQPRGQAVRTAARRLTVGPCTRKLGWVQGRVQGLDTLVHQQHAGPSLCQTNTEIRKPVQLENQETDKDQISERDFRYRFWCCCYLVTICSTLTGCRYLRHLLPQVECLCGGSNSLTAGGQWTHRHPGKRSLLSYWQTPSYRTCHRGDWGQLK